MLALGNRNTVRDGGPQEKKKVLLNVIINFYNCKSAQGLYTTGWDLSLPHTSNSLKEEEKIQKTKNL